MDKLERLDNFVKNMKKELEEEQEKAYEKSKNAANNNERIIYLTEAHQYSAAIRALFKISDEITNLQYENNAGQK